MWAFALSGSPPFWRKPLRKLFPHLNSIYEMQRAPEIPEFPYVNPLRSAYRNCVRKSKPTAKSFATG